MYFEQLTIEKLSGFINYCQKHQKEVDESYLENDELLNYDFSENITYIALDDNIEIIGVCSLMISDYYKKGKKARFRIFHSESENQEIYKVLFEHVLREVKDFDVLFLFIHEEDTNTQKIMRSLGFFVERYSYCLVKNDNTLLSTFPSGYYTKKFEFDKDEETWCTVLNTSFNQLRGHISDVTPSMLKKSRLEEGHMDEGMILLYHGNRAIGLVRVIKTEYNDAPFAYIGPIAVLPEYQKQGLGRNLLRYALEFGEKSGLDHSILTVNAENEKAVTLYLEEGFRKDEAVVCYNYKI